MVMMLLPASAVESRFADIFVYYFGLFYSLCCTLLFRAEPRTHALSTWLVEFSRLSISLEYPTYGNFLGSTSEESGQTITDPVPEH